MPHLTLEYTSNLSNLNPSSVLDQFNQALIASEQFEEPDIKSRALRLEDFAIGEASEGRGFVHVRLAILSGRSPETKSDLSHRLLAVLEKACPPVAGLRCQLSVEVQDIDRASYAKAST